MTNLIRASSPAVELRGQGISNTACSCRSLLGENYHEAASQ